MKFNLPFFKKPAADLPQRPEPKLQPPVDFEVPVPGPAPRRCRNGHVSAAVCQVCGDRGED